MRRISNSIREQVKECNARGLSSRENARINKVSPKSVRNILLELCPNDRKKASSGRPQALKIREKNYLIRFFAKNVL